MEEIDLELSPEMQGGCWAWIDKNRDKFHERTINLFDVAINQYEKDRDEKALVVASVEYKTAIKKMISDYKKEKGLDDAKAFIDSITAEPNPELDARLREGVKENCKKRMEQEKLL